MSVFVFRSSIQRLVSTIMIPLISVILIFARGLIESAYIKKSLIVFVVLWILLYVSRFLIINFSSSAIIIKKPINILFKTKVLFIEDLSSVELVIFKGPLFKFTLKNHTVFSVSFAASEKDELLKFNKYFKSRGVKTIGFDFL